MIIKLTFGPYNYKSCLILRRLVHNQATCSVVKSQDYLNFTKLKSAFLALQADRRSNQAEISRLSAFYAGLSADTVRSGNHLNSGLYFCSIFTKVIPNNIIKVAEGAAETIDVHVLKILAQKLLKGNQWPLVERLINQKFGVVENEGERKLAAEMVKFEVLALSGMYKKMVEMLPYLAKLNIPAEIQYILMRILNSKDADYFSDEKGIGRHMEGSGAVVNVWESMLLMALKGRLLSSQPPTFDLFLSLVQSISRSISVDSNTLFLAITKCQGLAEMDSLGKDPIAKLRVIFRNMQVSELISLAQKVQSCRKSFPQEIAFTLLQEICRNPANIDRNLTSSLLCWIIKYCPEKYPYEVLVEEYYDYVDQSLLNFALDWLGSSDRNALKFLEKCMVEKKLQVEESALKEIVDVAMDQYGIEPHESFLRLLHRRGYKLSSIFYLKYAEKLFQRTSITVDVLYECYRRIRAENLHGEVLQRYLSLGEDLATSCLRASDLDKSFSIFQSISKYNLLKNLERPPSFSEFVTQHCKANTFTRPFLPTVNLECIRAAFNCAQSQNGYRNLLDEKFCSVALHSALSQLDFKLAAEVRAFMNNMVFVDGGISSCQAILRHWCSKIK